MHHFPLAVAGLLVVLTLSGGYALPAADGFLTGRVPAGARVLVAPLKPQEASRGLALSPREAERFAMAGERILLEESDLGIINGLLTTIVPYRDVLSLRGLWAPPFACDLALQMRIGGEPVATRHYTWRPHAVDRQGEAGAIRVRSRLVLLAGQRACLLAISLENRDTRACQVPVQIALSGGALERVESWEFARPIPRAATELAVQGRTLIRSNRAGAVVITSDLDRLRWEPWSACWAGELRLGAGERDTRYLGLSIGEAQAAAQVCRAAMRDPAATVAQADRVARERILDLLARMPRFRASDSRLEAFYYRSLLHLLLNRWEVPEFRLHPCYTTGSVTGGCVCCYLWDYGEPWELLPLLDPAAVREHIKQYLRLDLTSHFAFNPLTAEAFGPWYPVNQEKIIRSLYYYVLLTGDRGFLQEEVAGKRFIDWAVYHALVGDDLSRPVALVDYGDGNHHLELRGKYRYDHVLPDLNGRRYDNYLAAWQLSELAGTPAKALPARAEAIKRLLRERMWSASEGWFHHLDPQGQPDLRYTVQMYKLIGSAVLDEEEEAGLLAHLNEREFLSAYGLHSMSKLDPGYDQADIDNGGGGCYVAFPPQVAERLYKAGHAQRGEDIMRRILWWGERLPYWGDSQVANALDYRRDTPLQCSIGGAAGAQAVIFGMFGVQVNPQGEILVNPRPPSFSPEMRLDNLRLSGCELQIRAGRTWYEVRANGRSMRARTGQPVLVRLR